jgi:predicted porin
MKKTLIALAAMGSFAGVAHAQSTVTLYGIADAGLVYTSNSATSATTHGKTFALLSGNESGSRWGLTGAEDLGGGLKAIFKLENGFNINNGTNGQGGRMFGRQAYVGLSGANFGSITMGRQYNAVQDYLAPLDVASVLTQFATHPLDNDNLNNTFRTDNAVKYVSPNIAGFQAQALYAFSNNTNFATNRSYSVGATYANGPVNVAAAYARMQNPGIVSSATAAAGTQSNPLGGSSRDDQWGLGGTVAFGPLTAGLLYTGSLFTNSTLNVTAASGTVHFNNYEGSVRYQLTPALVLAAGETFTNVHQAGVSGHYWQSNLGADYSLSKRTDLYATAIYQTTSKTVHAAIDASAGTASGQSQFVGTVGIRHKF